MSLVSKKSVLVSFPVIGICIELVLPAKSFAIISTFLAGYFPARKAQNMDPVEIIRGQ